MNTWVLGGTSGLGFEIARLELQAGHTVTVLGRHDPGVGGISFCYCDLLNPRAVVECGSRAVSERVDRFFWVAAAPCRGRFETLWPSDIRRTITCNVDGPMPLVQVIWATQQTMDGRRLFCLISSSTAEPDRVSPEEPIYAMTKAAQDELVQCIAAGSTDPDHRVVIVRPGGMQTRLQRDHPDYDHFMRPERVAEYLMAQLEAPSDTSGFAQIISIPRGTV